MSSINIPSHGTAITPSDSTVYTPYLRQLYIGVSGNLRVKFAEDSAVTNFVGIPQGTFVTGSIQQVHSTGTTATSIVGLW